MNNIDKINSGTTKGIFMINIPENSSINSQLTVLFIIYHKTLLELLVLLPHWEELLLFLIHKEHFRQMNECKYLHLLLEFWDDFRNM